MVTSYILPTAVCTSFYLDPCDLCWTGKTLWYGIVAWKREEGQGKSILALVGLGVFSSLVKFVDVAHNWFNKPGSDDFWYLLFSWSSPSTVPSAWHVVIKYLLSVHTCTHSVDKFILGVWLWAGVWVLGIWWWTKWICSCPHGACILVVKFTDNYSSEYYKEECISFSGNVQFNWEIRFREAFLQSIQSQKEINKRW